MTARGVFRESDLWLRLLFREHGSLSVFAFGGLHSIRRFSGCLDLLNTLFCKVTTSSRGYSVLQEASLIRGAGSLRQDWKRLGSAINCLKYIDGIVVPASFSVESFSLLEGSLVAIEAASEPLSSFPILFRFRLACELGYVPDLYHCASCGTTVSGACFLVDEGLVYCSSCLRKLPNDKGILISEKGLDALRRVQQNNPAVWPEKEFENPELRVALVIADAFATKHLQRVRAFHT